MGTVISDAVLYRILEDAEPFKLTDLTPRGSCPVREVRSHRVYEGSEHWHNVAEPRIPSEDDASGLGVPDASEITGYVYWHQGESGPRTALQTYADNIRQLTLAVHPLSAADCAPPSVAEVDYLRRRRAVKVLLDQKTSPRFKLHLGPVLTRVRNAVLALVAITQLKRLQANPIKTATPITVGIGLGILFSALSRRRRRGRRRVLAGLNAATDDLVHGLYQLLARHSSGGASVDWGALSRDPESCDGINIMMRKVWPFLEPHASRFLMMQVNRIFANYKPPIFFSLKMASLQLGARAPEVISMHAFSVTPRSVVLHAQVRLDGDDLYALLEGAVTGGNVKAGARNMRLSTLARIELMEPMEELPFFKAMSIAFVEPLQPVFALKLDTTPLNAVRDKVRFEPAVKPVLMNLLQNELFGRLCVWPHRLILPMRRRDHPLIKPILPRIQTHIKGVVAVAVHRGAGLPIECDAPVYCMGISVACLCPQ